MNSWSVRRLKTSIITFLILGVLFTSVAITAEFFLSRSQERVALEFMLIASLVIAMQTYIGNSGLLSFGHVAFFALAAYAAGIAALSPEHKSNLHPDLPDFIVGIELQLFGAIGVALILVLVLALFTGIPLSRMDPSVVPMATLAFLVIIHSVVNLSTGWTRGPSGIINIPDLVSTWTILASTLFITASALLFAASPWGLRLQAVREDPVAAAAAGIHVARMRLIGWIVSGLLMGLGGSVWALNAMAFSPTRFFFAETFTLLTMLVIGGIGSVSGAVLGAAIISLIAEVLRNFEGGFSIGGLTVAELPGIVQLSTAVLILLLLVWRTRGILGNQEFGGKLWRFQK